MSSKQRPFSLWSFLRNVLHQGEAIGLDCRERPYEEYSARMDAAAREREEQLRKSLGLSDETSRCIHDHVVCEKCAKMTVNKHLARADCGPVAAPVETLSVTHIFDGEEVVTALVDDGPVWIATFGVYSEADEFVKSLQREPGTTVVGVQRRSPVEPT